MTIKQRKCTSCGTEIKRYLLTGVLSPVEQWRIEDYLPKDGSYATQAVPISMLSFEEMFFLCFRSECQECNHIDLWDLPKAEVQEMIDQPWGDDRVSIGWLHNPDNIEIIVSKLPEGKMKESFKKLLEHLKLG